MDSLHELMQLTANPQQARQSLNELEAQCGTTLKKLSIEKQQALIKVLGNSNFLARWVRRESKSAAEVLSGDWESLPPSPEALLSLKKIDKIFSWEEDKLYDSLLKAKYEQLFRITLIDMGGLAPFKDIAWQLSQLARDILTLGLAWWQHQLQKQYGSPVFQKDPTSSIGFTILGMGKLGGMELNFSSDVDLIYFYGSDLGELSAPKKQSKDASISTVHGFFCKLVEKLSRFLSERSPGGFLYRVDLELRPEGKSGTLANSLEAMESYYENFGASWEKQAMIKAKHLSGDETLTQSLLKMLRPFIYPKTSDFRMLSSIQEMKRRLEASLQSSSVQGYHVKLGRGGIRELEFFVQSLQLLYGGRHPELQTQNTLTALTKLKELKFISEGSHKELTQAYLFLRTLENRLQQVEEAQVHRLPEDPEEQAQLSRRMDYTNQDVTQAWEALRKDLNRHCEVVEFHFASLLPRFRSGGI